MNKKGVNSPSFKDKTGEKHITNEGYEIQIIEYLGTYKCNIQFKDGTILNGIRQTEGNTGRKFAQIAAQKLGCGLIFPTWPLDAPLHLTDFNDLRQWQGACI